jgi:CheY-like chemotaxis protein
MIQGADSGLQDDSARAIATILVVEDEALIRMVLVDHLRDAGFEVQEVRSADEALRLLAGDPQPDLVFSDVNLPGSMNGIALARWLSEHRPDMPVLLTSGAGPQDMPADMRRSVPILMKPYDLDDALQRLQALLNRRGER